MKWIHIVAGLTSLVFGAIALWSAKGGRVHRRAGTVFAGAMLLMSSTGALMAIFSRPNPGNVVAGSLTFYLVATGLLTVIRPVDRARPLLTGFMLAAFALSLYALDLGFTAMASPRGHIGGIPAPPLFLFAFVGGIAALGDARTLHAGRIAGAQRLARHLWRMTFAMWIATTSFFLGQAKVMPAFLREALLLRALPVLLVTATLFWWLAKVVIKRSKAVPVAA